jgi:hypothetical protein
VSTPEGKVKEEIKKLLKHHDVYYFMPVQNGMGSPTLDFICCVKGRFFAVEAKAPGKEPTDRQRLTMEKISLAGGGTFVVSDAITLSFLDRFIRRLVSGAGAL